MPSEYNPQLVENMSAKFRRLNNPAHAMADAIGMLQILPGIVGIWSGGTPGPSGQLIDKSGNGLSLTRQNGLFGVDSNTLISRLSFDSTIPRYWDRTDEAITSITGTEAYIIPKGLTILCWLNIPAIGASTQTGIAKWNATGDQRSYALFFDNAGNALGQISNNGTASGIKSLSIGTYPTNQWAFFSYRFTPSTEVAGWINRTKTTNTSSVPASIFDSTANFTIGATHGGGNALSGRGSLLALFAAAVPDIFIDTYFQMTAPLFGVTV